MSSGIKFVKVGDLVQWVSSGANQWDKPRKVKKFSDDGQYAFFDETPTGIRADELEVVQASKF